MNSNINFDKEYTLKGKFEKRVNKNGVEYVAFIANITPTYKKLVLMKSAEIELLLQSQR